MKTYNVRLTLQPKNNTTPIAPLCYIPSKDLMEWFRLLDTFQNKVITKRKIKLIESLSTPDVQTS
jgi:hypothetical protein